MTIKGNRRPGARAAARELVDNRPSDARTRDAMRDARREAETDSTAEELAYACGIIAARAGLSLEESNELGRYAHDWRHVCERRQ